MEILKDRRGNWRHATPFDTVIDCPECNGSGCITVRHPSGNPELDEDVDCDVCGGEGEVIAEEDA